MTTATPTAPARARGAPQVKRRDFSLFNLGFQRRHDRPTLMLEPPVGSNDPVPDVERLPEDLVNEVTRAVGMALMIDCNGQQCQPIGSGTMWPFMSGGKPYFATNDHVGGEVAEVHWVSADQSQRCKTKLLGTDPKFDVAIMEPVEDFPSNLRAFQFSPVQLKIGDPVMAVGCPFGLPPMVTTGRVNLITNLVGDPDGDLIENLIGHQAVINPGNSGGPLVDALGRVHGLNTFGIMGSGFGFSVPIEICVRLLQELPAASTAAWLADDLFVGDTPYGVVVLTAPKAGGLLSRAFSNGRAKGKIREVTQFRDLAETEDTAVQAEIAASRRARSIFAPQFQRARTFSYLVGVNGEKLTSVAEAMALVASVKSKGRRRAVFSFVEGSSARDGKHTFGVKLSLKS